MCGTLQVDVLDALGFDFGRALERNMLMRQGL
jgi:hypothetical protein